MQRAFTIAQRVKAVVPKRGSQVTYASIHSSVVNSAIADDVAKASASLKRKNQALRHHGNEDRFYFPFL
jgi:hypothetical protein